MGDNHLFLYLNEGNEIVSNVMFLDINREQTQYKILRFFLGFLHFLTSILNRRKI